MTPDMSAKVRVVVAITTLLLGPLDVGSSIVSREGVLEMILVMASSGDFLQQRVASEALIAAANKKEKAKGILTQGVGILKKLYQTGSDNIKVRALVGLCKLGSSGGTDASWKPFSDGSTLKLAEACRRSVLIEILRSRWTRTGLHQNLPVRNVAKNVNIPLHIGNIFVG